jgi:hypothetical protein
MMWWRIIFWMALGGMATYYGIAVFRGHFTGFPLIIFVGLLFIIGKQLLASDDNQPPPPPSASKTTRLPQ